MAATKPQMNRIIEPSTGKVHYEPDALSGNVTLCGITDFIGVAPGEPTEAPVTCAACVSVFKWCNKHRA